MTDRVLMGKNIVDDTSGLWVSKPGVNVHLAAAATSWGFQKTFKFLGNESEVSGMKKNTQLPYRDQLLELGRLYKVEDLKIVDFFFLSRGFGLKLSIII